MNEEAFTDLFGNVEPTSTGSGKPDTGTVNVLAGLVMLGTGGSFAFDQDPPDATAPHANVVILDPHVRVDSSEPFFSPAARLGLVRRWLSLSITELAEVARVQRPTIYAWMSERSEPKAHNQHRLRELYRVASAWKKRVGRPFDKVVAQPKEAKAELLARLRAPSLEVAKILELFKTLAPTSRPAPSKLSRIVAEAGLEPKPHDEADRSFDTETRLG